MKVSELISILHKCNQDDKVTVSLQFSEDMAYYGGVIGVTEVTEKSIGFVTILADEEE